MASGLDPEAIQKEIVTHFLIGMGWVEPMNVAPDKGLSPRQIYNWGIWRLSQTTCGKGLVQAAKAKGSQNEKT